MLLSKAQNEAITENNHVERTKPPLDILVSVLHLNKSELVIKQRSSACTKFNERI